MPRPPLLTPRSIGLLGRAAISLWILLGLVHTGVVLGRPGRGWLWAWSPQIERVLGTPRDHEDASHLVVETLTRLERLPESSPVWITKTGHLEEDTWQYVQMQLAHLLYPRRVWVLTSNAMRGADERFGYAVTFGNDSPGAGWNEMGRSDRVTLYRADPQ